MPTPVGQSNGGGRERRRLLHIIFVRPAEDRFASEFGRSSLPMTSLFDFHKPRRDQASESKQAIAGIPDALRVCFVQVEEEVPRLSAECANRCFKRALPVDDRLLKNMPLGVQRMAIRAKAQQI